VSSHIIPTHFRYLIYCSYGFFAIPSHDRLVMLPSAPLRKRFGVRPSRPIDGPTNGISLSFLPPVPLPSKEASRIGKWTRMMTPSSRDAGGNIEGWTIKTYKMSKFRRRVYKGIPDRWRTATWDLMISRIAQTGPRDLARFRAQYWEAINMPSSYDVQIDLDVPRTISGHFLFHTRYGAGCVLVIVYQ
jgi:hypothetical protein